MTGFPFVRRRGPLALIGLSTALPTPPFVATGRLAATSSRGSARCSPRCARAAVPRRADPSSAGQRAGASFQPADRRRGVARGAARARRRARAARPRSRAFAGLARRAEGAHSGGRRAVGLGAPAGKHDPAGYNLYAIDGAPGAWRCEAIARGLRGGRHRRAEPATLMAELLARRRRRSRARRTARRMPSEQAEEERARPCASAGGGARRCASADASRSTAWRRRASARSRSISRLRDILGHGLDHRRRYRWIPPAPCGRNWCPARSGSCACRAERMANGE